MPSPPSCTQQRVDCLHAGPEGCSRPIPPPPRRGRRSGNGPRSLNKIVVDAIKRLQYSRASSSSPAVPLDEGHTDETSADSAVFHVCRDDPLPIPLSLLCPAPTPDAPLMPLAWGYSCSASSLYLTKRFGVTVDRPTRSQDLASASADANPIEAAWQP
jgi:hypothetical protein